MRRVWVGGLVGGLLGLGLALLGDAVPVYRGLWIYAGLVPGVFVALGLGPVAGLIAGLLTGAAGGSPFVALAVGLWLGVVGWLGQRRWPGFTVFLSVLLVLAPLAAVAYALGDQHDFAQVVPTLLSLEGAYLPTSLGLGLLTWVELAVHRRYGVKVVGGFGIALLALGMLLAPRSGLLDRVGTRYAFRDAVADGVRAAFVRFDISPGPELLADGVYMGGYGGRPGPAAGVHDPITFRLLLLEAGGNRVAFVQADTVGMGNRLYQRLAAATGKVAGTPHVFIGATHTHAGPDLQGLWGGVPTAYEDYLVDRLTVAAAEAAAKLAPAQLRVGQAKMAAIRNRRGWDPTPETLHVLQAVAAGAGGKPIGTLVNVAVHPTVLPRENLAFSSDFVGPMLAAVGDTALFLNGAQGDLLPDTSGLSGMPFEQAEAYGRQVAQAAAEALASARPVATPVVAVSTQAFHAPLQNWQMTLAMALGILRYDVSHAGIIPGVTTHVSLIRIGPDVTLLTVPGEMMTRLRARVETALPAGDRFVLGLTQDSLGYIIPRDEWLTGRNQNYEEKVSLGPAMANQIQKAVSSLRKGQ